MNEGNRKNIPDAPGFTVGVDELDERGHDGYDLETAKAVHLARAMDRIVAAAAPQWHPHGCGGFCWECHFASADAADLDRHERDRGHHYYGPLLAEAGEPS